MGSETGRSLEMCLPLRELFLQDYSGLEKLLVLINVVLFTASLNADNVDQDISTAILYMFFAVAYFVTTTACLSGANTLKNKACLPAPASPDSLDAAKSSPLSALSIVTPADNFVIPGKTAKAQSKKQASGKRANEMRKAASASHSEKKPQPSTSAAPALLKTRQKRGFCTKAADFLAALAMSCESYASRFLRIAFFTLNLVMLWLCVVNLD